MHGEHIANEKNTLTLKNDEPVKVEFIVLVQLKATAKTAFQARERNIIENKIKSYLLFLKTSPFVKTLAILLPQQNIRVTAHTVTVYSVQSACHKIPE